MLYLKNMPFRLFWQYLALFYISWLSRLVASLKHKWLHIWLWAQLYTLIFLPILLVQRISIQGGKVMKTSQFDQMLYKKVPPTEKSMSKILALFGIR